MQGFTLLSSGPWVSFHESEICEGGRNPVLKIDNSNYLLRFLPEVGQSREVAGDTREEVFSRNKENWDGLV